VLPAVPEPMRELTERDDCDEDEADAEHDEDRLLALFGGGLDGEQMEHCGNLPQRRMCGERFVDRPVARGLACGSLERGRVAAQAKRGASLIEPRAAAE